MMEDTNDELDILLSKLQTVEIPFKKDIASVRLKIAAVAEETSEDRKVIPLNRVLLGIAASIVILMVAGWLFLNPANDVSLTNSDTSIKTAILPDNSEVTLNAYSEISYDKSWNRTLSLAGEAFFNVTEGKTFTVLTDAGKVQVLGTSFNVFARDGHFVIACKTGKVEVTIDKSGYKKVLSPGEMIQSDSKEVKTLLINPKEIGSWSSGLFQYKGFPVKEVFKEISRQFDVEISVSPKINKKFTGYFNNKKLENALRSVCLPLNLTFNKTSENKYSISENISN
ncbi:MAG: FecR domain-containing protein [Bacteroidota bacterium]